MGVRSPKEYDMAFKWDIVAFAMAADPSVKKVAL